jgi:hypothetical protein
MFQLTEEEFAGLRSQFVTSKKVPAAGDKTEVITVCDRFARMIQPAGTT